ncbi:MAG: hypothetical protein K6T83_07460, partial [Alicyclobacillus sp.]|nr:hypothetical protein [Alicyclobacillus sp.]
RGGGGGGSFVAISRLIPGPFSIDIGGEGDGFLEIEEITDTRCLRIQCAEEIEALVDPCSMEAEAPIIVVASSPGPIIERIECKLGNETIAEKEYRPGVELGVLFHTVGLKICDIGKEIECTAKAGEIEEKCKTKLRPRLKCMRDIIVNAPRGQCGVEVRYPEIRCRGVRIECNPPSGSRFLIGASEVRCKVIEEREGFERVIDVVRFRVIVESQECPIRTGIVCGARPMGKGV